MVLPLCDEDFDPKLVDDPSELVAEIATKKVEDVCRRLEDKGEHYDLLIGADTIVFADGKICGKPKDERDAFELLKKLSGNWHTVYSGVCLKLRNRPEAIKFTESTKVHFGAVPETVLESYTKSGEALDKAGGYGIQAKGGSFVEKIEGDYFNVVGLPLHKLCKQLFALYSDPM